MRIPRIHVEQDLIADQSITLTPEISHYLVKVLRLKEDDQVRPFNGRCGEFIAALSTADRKASVLSLKEQTRAQAAPKLQISLGLGLSRGDRFDFAVQKATELGVSKITPLYTEFSEVKLSDEQRKEKKLQHWQNIASSAAEQSNRLCVPEVISPTKLADWAAAATEDCRLVLSPRASSGFSEVSVASSCALVVGPEGGFSPYEEELLEQLKFQGVNLGDRILRTETAPIAALAILQFVMGDLA